MNMVDDKIELVDMEQKKPLVIFKTEEDRYGRDITANFVVVIVDKGKVS